MSHSLNAQELIEDMQKVLLPVILDEAPECVVMINMEETPDDEWLENDSTICYMSCAKTEMMGLKFHNFEMEYRPSLLKNEELFKLAMAHELVHVAQHVRGDEFDYSKPYLEQDHEIEAYELQDYLLFYYNMEKTNVSSN